MKIRRLQYNIDYTHILTFREEYKSAVLPVFGFENLSYSIDNENTINESIRLIFKTEAFGLFIRKEGITFLFEGDINDLRNQNGVFRFFWDMYERITIFRGYKKTNRHSIIIHAVDILDKENSNDILTNCPYLKLNPFGKLDEFAAIYNFKKEDKICKFQFGNYSENDIKTHDLSPFETEFNNDLLANEGIMCKVEISEDCKAPSFSKFKTILKDAKEIISLYNI